MQPNQSVHTLINRERKKRRLPTARWSQHMYTLAKEQADYCANKGRLIHSNRFALQGGENLCGGKGRLSPKSIVRCWMGSTGHRRWLLDPRVREAGVAISKSRHGVYAAWSFSGDATGIPNIPLPDPIEIAGAFRSLNRWFRKHKLHLNSTKSQAARPKGGRGMLRIPISLFLGFIGVLAILLGAHGLYVYFSRLELIFGGEATKLFLSVDMPVRLQSAVQWMSVKGVQSWFIPAAVLAGGIVLLNYSNTMTLISNFLRKFRLW